MSVKKIIISIWNEFIYGGHLQCLGVVGIVYVSSFLLDIEIGWEILLATYLIFYTAYVNDRLSWIKLDEQTNLERTGHFKSYLSLMPKLILFAILLVVILLIYIGNLKFSIFSLSLIIFGLIYPFYLKNFTKKIIGFKNIYVAVFFAIMAAAPVIYYSTSLNTALMVALVTLMLLIFFKTVLMQILLDCKDVETDKSLGLLTIPALIGKEKTLNILKVSSVLITNLILFIAVFLTRTFPLSMLILLFIIPLNLYAYYLAQKGNRFGYILGSGEFLFWFILILFTKIMTI